MAISFTNRQIARSMWGVAAGLVEARDPAARDIARLALEVPTSENIRTLIVFGHGKEWLPSIIGALAEVGIAAAEDVLGDVS